MPVLMFWNLGGRGDPEAVGRLCYEHQVDILLLAEADGLSVAAINTAGHLTPVLWELPRMDSRVRALTRYPPGMLRPAFDDRHTKMINVHLPTGIPMLVVAVHLPSRLHADHGDQGYNVRRLRQNIEAQEARNGHQNTVVIGDLNANPFEDSLTAADGLHGVMDRAVSPLVQHEPFRGVHGIISITRCSAGWAIYHPAPPEHTGMRVQAW